MKTYTFGGALAAILLTPMAADAGMCGSNKGYSGKQGYGPQYHSYMPPQHAYGRHHRGQRPMQAPYMYRPAPRAQHSGYNMTQAYQAPGHYQPAQPAQAVTTDQAADDAASTVTIAGMQFQPAVVRVNAGEEVKWASQASMPHTVVSTDGKGIASQTMSNGSSFSHTFSEPGTYEYYCSIHPSMTGTVIVE